jgi:hypothetical protein
MKSHPGGDEVKVFRREADRPLTLARRHRRFPAEMDQRPVPGFVLGQLRPVSVLPVVADQRDGLLLRDLRDSLPDRLEGSHGSLGGSW